MHGRINAVELFAKSAVIFVMAFSARGWQSAALDLQPGVLGARWPGGDMLLPLLPHYRTWLNKFKCVAWAIFTLAAFVGWWAPCPPTAAITASSCAGWPLKLDHALHR